MEDIVRNLEYTIPKIMKVGVSNEYILCRDSVINSIAVSPDCIHWVQRDSIEPLCLCLEDDLLNFNFPSEFLELYDKSDLSLRLCLNKEINGLTLENSEDKRSLEKELIKCKRQYELTGFKF